MKQLLLSFFYLFTGLTTFSQEELRFVELGSESAYCRIYDYQNGNGSVYASASGGVPDYSYQWENLSTGETSMSSTWGGLNPGDYRITVTDNDGNTLSETITVDSLNPIANFDVISDDLDPIEWGYIGTAPATVTFVNTSLYFANPLVPIADTIFYFQPEATEGGTFYESYPLLETYTYNYGGEFDACMVALTDNGCTDTICKTIGLFGPLTIGEESSSNLITITSQPNSNQISIKQADVKNGNLVKIYRLTGQLILQEEIYSNTALLPFTGTRGIYIFEFYENDSMQLIGSGKFNY
ncbi:PKD domain-containing protein [Crocinitomix catalasitica]|uniref:PKD domain-containing protein n=1 Tax=Crocinitomix catalasitica TaxID=184607 RepID=UPI0004870C74|nr:PKD domain-containing protein [Crocinitomix catalasitica]